MPPDLSLALHVAVRSMLVPPGLLFVLIASGLALAPCKPALGRSLAWSGTLLLLALSLTPVDHALSRAAGGFRPVSEEAARAAQAIVILAGDARPAPEYGAGDSVGDLTLERLRYGVRLARRTGLPMLFSGGGGDDPSASLAELMQKAALDDYGLSARWLETKSRNTRENAQFSAPMLRAAGVRTIVLVTDDNHMRRALNEFAASGIQAIAAPVRVPAPGEGGAWANLLPSLSAFRSSSLALYELIGQAEQWLMARLGAR
jgi:uncharacterized SAM-binding protein YcdF (DUF218 family)